MEEYLSPIEKIRKARMRLLAEQPFWGEVVLNITPIEVEPDNPYGLDTASINSYGQMHYNRDFIDKHTWKQVRVDLIHEVLHLAFNHLTRRGTRHPYKWNVAVDIAANEVIQSDFALNPGMIWDEKYKGMAGEEIYDLLPDPKDCTEDCSKCKRKTAKAGTYSQDTVICKRGYVYDVHIEDKDLPENKSGYGNEDKQNLSKIGKDMRASEGKPNWEEAFREAMVRSKKAGTMPAGLDRAWSKYYSVYIDWRNLLMQYVQGLVPVDMTWRIPSKKSAAAGYFIPSTEKEYMKATLSFDMSGSISSFEMTQFLSAAMGIFNTFPQVELNVMSWDTVVYNPEELETAEDLLAYKPKGGGGTDCRPVFEYIEENEPETEILVMFTDSFATYPTINEIPPFLNVIWVVSSNGDLGNIPNFFPVKIQIPEKVKKI